MRTMSALPGGPIASRPLHFIWILDCSGSMQGEKIGQLNFAIREAIPAMQLGRGSGGIGAAQSSSRTGLLVGRVFRIGLSAPGHFFWSKATECVWRGGAMMSGIFLPDEDVRTSPTGVLCRAGPYSGSFRHDRVIGCEDVMIPKTRQAHQGRSARCRLPITTHVPVSYPPNKSSLRALS